MAREPYPILPAAVLATLLGACRTQTTEGQASYQLCHQLCEMVADPAGTDVGRADAARMLGRIAGGAPPPQRRAAVRTLEDALAAEAQMLRDAARAALVELRTDLARHMPLFLDETRDRR